MPSSLLAEVLLVSSALLSGGLASSSLTSSATPSLPAITPLPPDALVLAESGIAAHDDGRVQDAVADLTAALELAEGAHAPTLINLGLVWETIGLPLQAMDCYSRAIDADPNAAFAYHQLGLLLHEEMHEDAMAEEALRKAVELTPSRSTGWAHLGRLLEGRGALEEALEHLRQAALLEPSSENLRNLATVQRATGQFEAALGSLEAAVAAVREPCLEGQDDSSTLEDAGARACRLRALGRCEDGC